MAEEPPNSRTDMLHKAVKEMVKAGCILDVSHFNAILRVYLENEHQFDQQEFLSLLARKNIQPNRVKVACCSL